MPDVRTLLWDIETSPNLGWIWGKWEQNVIKFDREWHILSIAWKWLGDKNVQVKGLPDYPRYKVDTEDDLDLVALAHSLFCEADIVVGHNGKAFDTKKGQSRMFVQGYDPPSPFKEIDTLKVARKYFAFNSNRLDDLCQSIGLGKKLDTGGFETWLGCIRGDRKAWAQMKQYNAHDVVLLEGLYLRLQPWIAGHPNVATISGRPDVCPKCGSDAGMIRRGYTSTSVSRRVSYQCKGCGGYSSGRKTERTDTDYV
jgi:hypothetical protein